MTKRIVALMAATGTAMFLSGCCTSNKHQAQGAPAVEQTTEVTAATGGPEIRTEAEIPLHKEEMVVGKRDISNGGVLIRKIVHTEDVSQPIELKREEYVIERIPAGEARSPETAAAIENAFKAREVYIPLTREEAIATTRGLLAEKVQLGKRIETDHQTVSTSVRSEDVEVTKTEGKASAPAWQGPSAGVATSSADPYALNLVHEEMVVGKSTVDNGGVKLQKVVRTQTASQPVDLRREEYVLQRTPAADKPAATSDFAEKEIRMNLSREEAVVGTRVLPTEYVRVRKQIQTDTQIVNGKIRKENIEIVKIAPEAAPMGGTAAVGSTNIISESGPGSEK